MSQRRSSTLVRIISPTSTSRRFSILPISDRESDISNLSFKHWHKRMQYDHEVQSGGFSFGLWHWCEKGCKPCRWFDSIEYEKKICKCCFTFRTFKAMGTILIFALFIYAFMFSILKEELLPGGTIFFIFLLFVAAYFAGYVLIYAGLPPMLGHLLVGITCGNVPSNWLPAHDPNFVVSAAKIFEKVLLLIALIRAGLTLELAKIKSRIIYILRISIFPLLAEFIAVAIVSHFLLKMPWDWSALLGSVLCILSLASVTSVMVKNRANGYGEDKHFSTVLIASSALCATVGFFLYIGCLNHLFPDPKRGESNSTKDWKVLLQLVIQISIGATVGTVAGLLVAFFPDKRNVIKYGIDLKIKPLEAAALRIGMIGAGSLAIANLFNEFNMPGAGLLGVIIMCLVASNFWEELGWHQDSNPVQYFYSMAYYFGQPATLSLLGYTMNFKKSDAKDIGLSFAIICIGLVFRETVCFLSTLGQRYPTTVKEKIFICIAWFSKGTFQGLLAFAAEIMAIENKQNYSEEKKHRNMEYANTIKQTSILAILLTTPLAYLGLTLLTPILLSKSLPPEAPAAPHHPPRLIIERLSEDTDELPPPVPVRKPRKRATIQEPG